jgi:hypothetical protein
MRRGHEPGEGMIVAPSPPQRRPEREITAMHRFASLLALFLIAISSTGCEAIATIFEAGVWVGVIIVVVIIAVIFGVMRMIGGGRGA